MSGDEGLPGPPGRAACSRSGALEQTERAFLLRLQHEALQYFLDNQKPDGLMLDRQHNHRPPMEHAWCSTAATGMGLIALALAAAEPYRLLTPAEAARRIGTCLETALDRLPHDHGMMPHFTHSATGEVVGEDVISTIDSAWLLTGALWAAAFLRGSALEEQARRLYERVDWTYWALPDEGPRHGLVRQGKRRDGLLLPSCWDRLNGETVFLYVLGAGAAPGRALGPESWQALRPFYGTVAGYRFSNADLGLFAFEYGIDLLDWQHWQAPGPVDLPGDAVLATWANRAFCRELSDRFVTYRRYWGLSDGEGPGEPPETDAYRAYSPVENVDGTAHLMATLAAVGHDPAAVLENLYEGEHDQHLRPHGRYGFSNVNVDRDWVARDVVGIDAGAAVLAVDNYLMGNRVRLVFQAIPCVRQGMGRLGFIRLGTPGDQADHPPTLRDALA
jgi:hypothetical protein